MFEAGPGKPKSLTANSGDPAVKLLNVLAPLCRMLRMVAPAALVLALSGPARADTNWGPYPIGANGDRSDVLACGPGTYIAGFTVKKGAWFDAVGVLCGAVNTTFNGMDFRGPAALPGGATLLGGIGGGVPENRTCNPTDALVGLDVYATDDARQVVLFGLNCSAIGPNMRSGAIVNYPLRYISGATEPGWHVKHSQYQGCRDHEAAYAIEIRYGRHVNAVGLRCRRLEAPPAPPPPPPPPPPPTTNNRPIKTTGKSDRAPVASYPLSSPPHAVGPFGPPPNFDTPTQKIGAGGGTAFDTSCPAGMAVGGWHYNANASLTAIAPYCRNVGQTGETGYVGMAGADDPDAQGSLIICPGTTLVRTLGVYLTVSGRVHYLRSICFPAPNTAGSAVIPPPTLTLGGASVTNQIISCPGSYATGFVGTFVPGPGGSITSIGLKCFTPGAAAPPQPAPVQPAPAQPAPAEKPTVTVKLAADVYAAKGGEGATIGVLEENTQGVTLLEPCRDDWCHVSWPGHEGWVYSGTDYDSLGLHGDH